MQSIKSPTEIDKLVGVNIRGIRLIRGMTQKGMAEKLGLTFQQIQKYESGANRMSASRLVQLADVLKCSIIDLFHGIDTPADAQLKSLSKTAVQAAVVFDAIEDQGQRQALFLLMSSLVDRSGAIPTLLAPQHDDFVGAREDDNPGE